MVFVPASRSPSAAQTVSSLPLPRTWPSGTSSAAGTGEPSSSSNSRWATASGSSSGPCSPLGIDQAPSSFLAQNGPPMWPSSTSTPPPSAARRHSSTPALVLATAPACQGPGRCSGGVPPHGEHRRPAAGQRQRVALDEPVPGVERPVPLAAGLQVRRGAGPVALLEHRPQQRGAQPPPLPGRLDADVEQVPVRRQLPVVRLHVLAHLLRLLPEAQFPAEQRHPARRVAQVLPPRGLPPARREPHRAAGP